MNEIKVFENKDFGQVRTVTVENEPWFVLADVCKVLEIARGTRTAERLEEDEVRQTYIIDSIGRQQEAKFITEGNVYRLITHSKLHSAEKFESWVFDEAFLTSRKVG